MTKSKANSRSSPSLFSKFTSLLNSCDVTASQIFAPAIGSPCGVSTGPEYDSGSVEVSRLASSGSLGKTQRRYVRNSAVSKYVRLTAHPRNRPLTVFRNRGQCPPETTPMEGLFCSLESTGKRASLAHPGRHRRHRRRPRVSW